MKKQQRSTLSDIAKECGVSEMTVSRALRNQKHVRSDLRKKILRCADRLKYRPDPLLSALVNRRTRNRKSRPVEPIAFIVPEDPQFGWSTYSILLELKQEIQDAARSHGYGIQLHSVPRSDKELPRLLRVLHARGVRGILLGHGLNLTGVKEHAWDRFTVLTLEPSAHNARFHAVRSDFFQMAECAVRELHGRGCRRIGYVMGPTDSLTHFRAVGALAACEEMLPGLVTEPWRSPGWRASAPRTFWGWIRAFKPEALISVSTHPYTWLSNSRTASHRSITFVQLNRPRSDTSVHGVCQAPEAFGGLIIQRLHQLLLDDVPGLPEVRAIVRVDGHWRESGT